MLAVAESSETLSRFQLKSLIDGAVIKRHVTLGEHLAPDDTAFVVADLSTLWVDIALYPKQVPLVKPGQPVRITTSHGPAPVETNLGYVAPLVDEATRTGLARVFLANTQNHWKPGMFIEGQITLGEFPAAVAVSDVSPRWRAGCTEAYNPHAIAATHATRRSAPASESGRLSESVAGNPPTRES